MAAAATAATTTSCWAIGKGVVMMVVVGGPGARGRALPCLALAWLGFDTLDTFPTHTAWGPSPPSPISPLPWPHAPLQRRRRGAWEHADAWVPDESWSAG